MQSAHSSPIAARAYNGGMDWFVDLLKDYGGTALAIVGGMVIVIVLIAMTDRHNTSKPSDAKKKEAPRDDH